MALIALGRTKVAWEAIERRPGPERVAAFEDAGLSIVWGADHVELSLPFGWEDEPA